MKLTEILILLTVCLFYGQAAENHISDLSNSVPATVKLTAVSGLKVSAPNDGLNKRDVKATELSGIITGKNYAPPPPHEYNRYSSSTSATTYDSPSAASTANENAYEDSETAGFISKPVTFPDSYSRNKYLSPQTTTLEGRAGDSWHAIKEAAIAKLEGRDRTGLGQHGAAEYEYERHTPNPYISGQNTAYGPAGYGLGAYGDDTLNHHYSPADAVPFDVYNKAHYAGHGPEYSYSNYDYHEPISHKGHYDYSHKELLAKSFLIPLASATVLGIAAALVSNPLLLQLGTISGAGVLGKRRRRRRRRDLTQPLALAYHAHLPATLQANGS